jgi:hypothetical protein
VSVSSYSVLVNPTESELKQALLDGPLAVNMRVYADFESYTGGVYFNDNGTGGNSHVVTLVGWDDTTSPPSWVVRNSWGDDWGNQGYANIARGVACSGFGMCFATEALTVEVDQSQALPYPCLDRSSLDIAHHIYDGGSIYYFQLSNCGGTRLDWTEADMARGFALYPEQGQLAPAASEEIMLSFSPSSYAEGDYQRQVSIASQYGSRATIDIDIHITEPPQPVVDFTPSTYGGQPPLEVSFTNTTTGYVDYYRWDFGDGGSSTEKHPSHIYTAVGDYTVTLTAYYPGGGEETQSYSNLIAVYSPGDSSGPNGEGQQAVPSDGCSALPPSTVGWMMFFFLEVLFLQLFRRQKKR